MAKKNLRDYQVKVVSELEETYLKPKPLIEVGGKPLLWHIMKIYSHYDINDFVICLGYKGYMIKEYFNNYFLHTSDVTIDIKNNKIDVHQINAEPWRVTLVDTGENYKFLSIKRGKEPFKGMWANPGGNIDESENPRDAAVRELEEETNLVIEPDNFYYVGAFDKPYRDPRNKNCVSHAFVIVLDEMPDVVAGDDATECTWNDVSYDGDVTVDMAFDHAEIIKKSILTFRILSPISLIMFSII